ncbi:hypothetical protein MKW92_047666, partial [Papaver armeniacum]
MHHSSIDPSVTAATGSQNVMSQKTFNFSIIVSSISKQRLPVEVDACTPKPILREDMQKIPNGVHNPKAHMDTENEEE